MTLLPDWRDILKGAWSIRWGIAAALFSGLEVALPFIDMVADIPRGMFAAISGACTGAAVLSRLLVQKKMSGGGDANQ
jgi:hypothetical protein